MPPSIHEGSFSLSAFEHEAAFLIRADCAFVVSKNPYSDAMEFQFCKRMLRQQTDGVTSYAFSEKRRIIYANRHGRSMIPNVEAVKLDFPDKTPFNFNNPSVRIFRLPLSPTTGCFSRHRLRVRPTYPKHLNDVDISPQCEASLCVIKGREP